MRARTQHPDPASRPLAHRVFLAFHQAMRSHATLMAKLVAEHSMHPSQAFALSEIAHADGLSQRELAKRLRVAPPTVNVMLKKMERAGLVERRVDEKDQRFTRIHVTDQGMRLHDEMHAIVDDVVAATIAPLSEADQKRFERLLLEFNANTLSAIGATSSAAKDGHATEGGLS